MSRNRRAIKTNGQEIIAIQQTDTIPVDDLRELHEFRPDLVDRAFKAYEEKTNESKLKLKLFFTMFIVSIIAILSIIGVGVYLIINGYENPALILFGTTCAFIVAIFVKNKN